MEISERRLDDLVVPRPEGRFDSTTCAHDEPVFDDDMIEAVLTATGRFKEVNRDGQAVEIISAYDRPEPVL